MCLYVERDGGGGLVLIVSIEDLIGRIGGLGIGDRAVHERVSCGGFVL